MLKLEGVKAEELIKRNRILVYLPAIIMVSGCDNNHVDNVGWDPWMRVSKEASKLIKIIGYHDGAIW